MLQRGDWNHNGVVALLHHQPDVHKLVGEQNIVRVLEDCLQLIGAGGRVDLVVDRQQFASVQQLGVGAVIGLNGKRPALAQQLDHLWQLVLWQGEDHRDGMELGDHQQAGGVGRMHDVAWVDESQSDAAIDWRRDAGVGEVDLGGVDGGVVGFDRALELAVVRLLQVERLLGHHSSLEQGGIAVCLGLGVVQRGLVFG